MKKASVIHLIALLLLAQTAISQSVNYYVYQLRQQNNLRHKIYFDGIKNTSENLINIDSLVFENLNYLAKRTFVGNDKIKSANEIMKQALFLLTTNKSEADVIIGGEAKQMAQTVVDEKLYRESENIAGSLPYYSYRTENKVEINLILSYSYPDASIKTDTFNITKNSLKKPGKKLKPLDYLLNKSVKELDRELFSKFEIIDRNDQYFKFPKIKVKDKNLKKELTAASELFKSGQINQLLTLIEKVNATESSEESRLALGICYELLGNYQKALEFYAEKPNFHTKVRMKRSIEMFNYLKEIGCIE